MYLFLPISKGRKLKIEIRVYDAMKIVICTHSTIVVYSAGCLHQGWMLVHQI